MRSYYFHLDVLVLPTLIFNLLDNGIYACGDEEDRVRLFDNQELPINRSQNKKFIENLIILLQALMGTNYDVKRAKYQLKMTFKQFAK